MERKKMTKKYLLCLMIAVLFLCLMSGTVFAADFSDMPDNWSTQALTNAVNNGLLAGSDGKINADAALTRAEMAAIMNRAFASTKSAVISFSDVPSGAWYAQDVAKAIQMQTFTGYDDNTFKPNAAITRQEAFVVIARAFRVAEGSEAALAGFADSANISPWAKAGVAGLVETGYVSGHDGNLYPKAKISRAEFAQIMDNMVAQYIKTPGTVTSLMKGNVMVNIADVTLENVTVQGDLIIADGVGDGDFTLNNVKITGAMIVRGGGTHSIIIVGNSSISHIVISRVDGAVRVVSQDGTEVPLITVDDGKDGVILEGQIDALEVAVSNVPVMIQEAQVGSIKVAAANANVAVDQKSTVTSLVVAATAASATVNVSGTVDAIKTEAPQTQLMAGATAKITTVEATAAAVGASITTTKGANITTVTTAAANTAIIGTGTVTTVAANADYVSVTTPGTQVTAGEGTTGVTAGDETIDAGETQEVSEDTSSSSSSDSSTPTMRGVKITVSYVDETQSQVMNITCSTSDILLDKVSAYLNDSANDAIVSKIVNHANQLMTSMGETEYNNKWDEFFTIFTTGGQVTAGLANALNPGYNAADADYVHSLASNVADALVNTTTEGKTAVQDAIDGALYFNISSKDFAKNLVDKLWGNPDMTIGEFFTGEFISGATVTAHDYTLTIEKWIQ